MKLVEYTDAEGRKFKVQLPDSAPDEHAAAGILVGPPDLRDLGLPVEVEVRLNHQLYNRGLLTRSDMTGRIQELRAAIQGALSLDVQTLQRIYEGIEAQ